MYAISCTDVGKKRCINEDYLYFSTKKFGSLENIFILADGMGGANAGEYASYKAVELIKEYISSNAGEAVSLIDAAIRYANSSIYEESLNNEEKTGMGTTIVVATVSEDTLYVANVGDSRLYLIEDSIRQITRDHTYVQELVQGGYIIKYSDEYEKNKHKLTRALGPREDVKVDIFELDLNKKDRILLCTDGLSNMLSDEEMYEIIKDSKLDAAAFELVEKANEKGGKDNISLILIENVLEKSEEVE